MSTDWLSTFLLLAFEKIAYALFFVFYIDCTYFNNFCGLPIHCKRAFLWTDPRVRRRYNAPWHI